MSATRKRLTLVAVAFSLALFTACGQEPVMVSTREAQFAKGGGKGGGGTSKAELAMVGYQVEVLAAGETHAPTDDPGVNTALQAWLEAHGGTGEPTDPPEIYDWNGDKVISGTAADFFGCPDSGQPCNKVTATFSGQDWESIGALVEPSVQGCGGVGQDPPGGCVFDENLGDHEIAVALGQMTGLKAIEHAWLSENSGAYTDNGDGTFSLTWYWQGQRVERRYEDGQTTYWHYLLSFFPDLERAGETDSFVFRFNADAVSFPVTACIAGTPGEQCWAEYQGRAPAHTTWTVVDGFEARASSSGRGKNKIQTVSVSFAIQSFVGQDLRNETGDVDYTDRDLLAASVGTDHTVMVTSPSGARTIVTSYASGKNSGGDKAGFWGDSYAVPLTEGAGCYEVRLLMGYVYDIYDAATYTDNLNTTSTADDTQGHLTSLTYDPDTGLTYARGMGCPMGG